MERPLTITLLFLRLGLTAFGGPAAHIAMMRHEFVTRREWLTDRRFLDLLGVTNLIPGPNSTEMAIHLGRERAGWRGLVGAGVAFIAPAAVMVSVLAWVYVEFGSTPAVTWVLYGVKPVVIAIVAQAIWGLGRVVVRRWQTALLAAVVIVLGLLGVNELVLLFGGAAVGAVLQRPQWLTGRLSGVLIAPLASVGVVGAVPTTFSLLGMALLFLKIGAVLYGSGYVLLAFLRADFVERMGWLTETQLLDAVAIGQVTPGPVFTTATFIGFVLAGVPGAVVATVAIFLPSFVFVAAVHPLVERLRASSITAPILDAVNAAAVGLMTVVMVLLGRSALVDVPTVLAALVALGVLIFTKVNSLWLILAGAALGAVVQGVGLGA
ncbi:MAG: chromate efflux transporter [Chloroflexota bacterium]|nr:chromate efflux transporter [Chloroflexota bacterium]MDE2918763.1 chromate efflux transporter [Chloroflexota bacterium]